MTLSKLLLTFCACACLVSPGVALAQQAETTPIPVQPKPDFSGMNFMLGTWTCSTKSSRRAAPFTLTSTYTASPDGWWINETTTAGPIPWFPQQTTTYDKYTYDADTKRWIDVQYGDLGAYGLATSPGWMNNTIVWHDNVFAPTADIASQTDTTVTKNSDMQMTASSSFTEASGRNVTVVSTCNKS